MAVIHFSYAADGGAGRAGRRAARACRAAGINSTFSYVAGKPGNEPDICFEPVSGSNKRPADLLTTAFKNLQWDFVPSRRTNVSNTLLSIGYPGLDLAEHPVFTTADIIHLHWPTWGVTPNTIRHWLDTGRTVFWTLHDFWSMTGGCHYPTGCQQYLTRCLKCPQIQDDLSLVSGSFNDKYESYALGGKLSIITPSEWMGLEAGKSRILGGRPINVVRNPVELDIFYPREDRPELRQAFGVSDNDLLLFLGSFDLAERRKGIRHFIDALNRLLASGDLMAALPSGARVFLATCGRSSSTDHIPGVLELDFGNIDDNAVLADVLCIADLVCVPSIEDNYPNIIVEAMACGTPCLGMR